MSNNQTPPSYGGYPTYAQWPPPYPGMMPPNISPGQYPPALAPQLVSPGQPFQYNGEGLNQNASVPMPPTGAPAGPGVFYPPPFPFVPLDPSQAPQHQFPPAGLPPLGYPPIPVPPGSSQPPPGVWGAQGNLVDTGRAIASETQTRATSYTNSYPEEGEIGDEETAYKPTQISGPPNGPGLGQAPALNDDLEEGEALSSRSSNRSSSPDPDVVSRAIEMQKREATTATSEESQPTKSAAQLKVQAQGALLSLAPHNIRYDELVAEGINPTLLKKLYEDVGIRVATPQSEKQVAPSKPSNAIKPKDAAPQPAPPVKTSQPADVAAPNKGKEGPAEPAVTTAAKHTPATSSPPTSNKPMERKEVIARMLAAKAAARASEPKAVPKESTAISPPVAPTAKTNGTGTREKNKAQTELARQRIEELKKQAMIKRQEKSKQLSQASTVPSQPHEPLGPAAPAVQHPLPVRPPPPSSDSAKIPGLLLTGSDPENNLPTPPSQTIGVDSTPLSRTAQRKRPRASDFDEPTSLPKKPFGYSAPPSDSENKLIIDISEDESLYGDDEGANMDVDSSPEQDLASAPSLDAAKPPLSRASSTGRISTSTSTPHDQESIRERDLQIQAMHRRIAELEQKRKEKLAASRTQSPHASSDSTASSSIQSSAVGADNLETSSAPASSSKLAADTCTSVSSLVDRPDLMGFFSESSIRVLASMDIAQLDSIRSKILRMKEIESGLPELDHEIESAEQRLAACKQEADGLLADITKGKQGRLYLVDELKRLSDEINGLTLEDLDELRRQAEIKEQHLATKEASPVTAVPTELEGDSVPVAHSPSESEAPANISQVHVNETAQNDEEKDIQEAGSPSQSSSDGSSMDESEDSDSSEESSSVQEEHAVPSPPISAEPTAELSMDLSNEETSDQLSLNSESEAEDIGMADEENLNQETEQSRRETSAESDDYEPPEPDTGAESPGSTYSPPLSPAPLAILDAPTDPAPQRDHPPDEAFTGALPVPARESRQITEILGAPGTELPITQSDPKFTPYTSPLKMFEAYRFHPDFLKEVSGGYRSLTYSHDIDSMKLLCPYELAGGVCNDHTCGFQHFRDMTPSDDKILVQMGALREGQTEQEKETYRTGLKEIINGMRRDKVKDFITVANEIAAYRRRVLQDPSRVLHL